MPMPILDAGAALVSEWERPDGYAPLRAYAAIGDGRTVALVAADGAIDWLCLPDLDSPPVLGAILDAEGGGSFELHPELQFSVRRRYLPQTNVLETTFDTARGTVRVLDAMTLPAAGLSPHRELVRKIESVSGTVPMCFELAARFGCGQRAAFESRAGVPVAVSGADAVALCGWNVGGPAFGPHSVHGRFVVRPGAPAVLVLSAAHQEPLVLPSRADVEARLSHTIESWRAWSRSLRPVSMWTDSVVRSALALKLLVYAPSGAIAAAATTSVPEVLGGERNWDYRFCWVRDSAFVLDALLRLGCSGEAEAFFWWLMQASQLTHPRLRVLYRLDGGTQTRERTLPLAGYRHSVPVRVGNGAEGQLQLDVYGDLLQTAWVYARAGGHFDRDIGRRLSQVADLVCRIWREPDAGLWETRSTPQHFTQSKMMCAIALDRAIKLATMGHVPSRHLSRWMTELQAVRSFVEEECWSTKKQSYVRHAGAEEVDASLLLGVLFGYEDPRAPRLRSTVDAVLRDLSSGPYVFRYRGSDGLEGSEGAFLTCSFWLVEALALQDRHDEADKLMASLVELANDVGIFAEEVDPHTGEFLGNLPQGLTHLSLISAAMALAAGEER
jgi:GH15 family glucan-1,4-alpha-glucosidase